MEGGMSLEVISRGGVRLKIEIMTNSSGEIEQNKLPTKPKKTR